MPRKPRILTDSGIYHIISRGNNRRDLFHSASDFRAYLELIRAMKLEYSFELYHYCLMTNHVHLLTRFYESEALQKVMQRVNLGYAKRYRRNYGHCGHVFQDRFKSLPIERDSYLLECGRYIERNPLQAGLAQDLTNYAWSSYAFYVHGTPNPLITMNPLFETLGFTPEERQRSYREYLLIQRPYEGFIQQGLMPV